MRSRYVECHTLDPGFHGRLSCLPGVSPGSFPFLLRILKVVARLLRVDYSLKVKRKKKTCPKASVRLFLSLCACYLSQRGEVGCISAQGPGEESRVLFWRNVIRRYRVAAADSLCGVSVRCALPPREFVVTKRNIAGIAGDLSSGRVTQLSYLRRR